MENMTIKDTALYREISHNAFFYGALGAQAIQAKALLDSGDWTFDCFESYNGQHEWRKRTVDAKGYWVDCVAFCWHCKKVDATQEETNRASSRPVMLIKK